MSLLRPVVVLAFLLGACGGSGNGATPAVDTDAGSDAGSDPTGMDAAPEAQADAAATPMITVTTLAPAVPGSPGGKANATWAAWQADDGPWHVLTPTTAGTYSFAAGGARWAIALACADGGSSSAVDVHRRLADTVSLEVTLEPECVVQPAAFQTLSGMLSNVPAATSWLELGYPLESRGSALAVSATTAPYELVNAAAGTWDFAFGLRDDSLGPLTRVVLQRGKAFTVDTVLDIDFTSALVPIPKMLAVHGLDTAEIVDASIFYSSSAFAGLAVGPQNVPTTAPDMTTSYDTLPPASQIPSDRYRLTLSAAKDKTSAVVRTIEASFHLAINVDLTVPPVMGVPTTVTAKKTATSVEVSARAPVYAGAESYALVASVDLNDRNRRAFRTTLLPSMVADTFVLTPDLAALPGFDPTWLLPQDSPVDIAAVAVEAPAALGDGTRIRTSSHKLTMTP